MSPVLSYTAPVFVKYINLDIFSIIFAGFIIAFLGSVQSLQN